MQTYDFFLNDDFVVFLDFDMGVLFLKPITNVMPLLVCFEKNLLKPCRFLIVYISCVGNVRTFPIVEKLLLDNHFLAVIGVYINLSNITD